MRVDQYRGFSLSNDRAGVLEITTSQRPTPTCSSSRAACGVGNELKIRAEESAQKVPSNSNSSG